MSATHLVVLVHGLWGAPTHLHHLRDVLQEQHPTSTTGLHILLPKSNANYFTYDGIEVGAERITNEIEAAIKELKDQGSTIRKISITGYSLGGLVARYIVGLLYKNGLFDDVEPVNFTTFASPHLGVRAPSHGYGTEFWNFMGSRTLSSTGQQMFLVDDFRGTGRNLLEIMTDPNSAFIAGLCRFKNRYLYANTINDRSVPYFTAAISKTDPFVDLNAIDANYLPNQKVVLNPANPATPRKPAPKVALTLYERLSISERTRKELAFYALFTTMLPLAVPLFLVNAGYQTYKSAQRIRLHEAGDMFDLQRYSIPLLEEVQAVQNRVIERLAAEQANHAGQYLPTPPPEPLSPVSSSESLAKVDTDDALEKNSQFPILALTAGQLKMIDNLDQVGFVKFSAHIINVRHTHAAIVVRTPKESFAEGREVVDHWAKRFEV